jgi:hypothetical protein
MRAISARSASSPSPVTADTRRRLAVSREKIADLGLRRLQELGIDEVTLGEGDEPAADLEEAADVQVLARLRHDALVRRDDEQHRVDPRGAGHHPAHEPLVTGHVHHPGRDAAGKRQVRESEIDGDPARLLLGEAVGVDARERAHQGSLPVIDVSGGPENDGAHGRFLALGWCHARRSPAQGTGRPAATVADRVTPSQPARLLLPALAGIEARLPGASGGKEGSGPREKHDLTRRAGAAI